MDRLIALERRLSRPEPRPGEPGLGPPPADPYLGDQPFEVPDPQRHPLTETREATTRKSTTRILKVLAGALGVVLVIAIGSFAYVGWRIGQIDRVDVSSVLAPTPQDGPTWLIVGSDSRAGIDPDRPDAGGLLGEVVYGERADTIILVRDIPEVGVQMLSLPRDLWFDPPGDNNATRINGAYNKGAAELIRLIDAELGIQVNRYAEIDLAGLDAIVDAAGGVTVDIPNPGYDDSIGLRIDTSGPVELDGATALAYVRTRKWTEIVDGVEVYDGTGDLGRNRRQQTFLAALGSKLGGTRNPFALNSALAGITDAVRADDAASFGDMYGFARMLQSASQAPALPIVNYVTPGGAAVLLLGEGSGEVLDLYR